MKNINFFRLHSMHIVTVLLISLVLGSIGVGYILARNPFIKIFDGYFYELIHKGYHADWIDFLIRPFNYNFLPDYLSPGRMPSYFYFMILGTLIYLFFYKRSLLGWAIFCFIFGTLLAMLISALDWHFVFRERPFLTLPNTVDFFGKSAWEKLSSYPSGHARETALYSTIIANFIPELKWVLLIFVLFIGYSRIYIGAHFPTDIIAGILIGFLTGKVILIIARELQIILSRREDNGYGQKPKS